MDLNLKQYEIIIKNSANKDLNQISKYIIDNFKSINIAEKLLARINKRISILQEYPNAFQTLNNYQYKGYKCKRLVVENYSIIYYILEEQKKVIIIHVFYNKRNFFNS